ncbi:MAG: transporter substrate-binding domain-containing protein [Anaerolineales bacterium]
MMRIAQTCLFAALILAACSPGSLPPTEQTDKLAEIVARGTLIIATDADYVPLSKLLPNTSPAAETKCSPVQYTANQMIGFDVSVGKEIAQRLGVEPCFVTPPWSQLVAGNWGDNWDVHVGSVAITSDRMKWLYFSQPYYATPTVILIHKDNAAFTVPEDLSGKRIGVCVGCTFEAYLKGMLQLPAQSIEYRIQNAEIVGYENEDPAIQDLSEGDGVKLDAVITLLPVARQALKAGYPVKILGEPLWFSYASVTLDRSSRRSQTRLLETISKIIRELHADGTLKKWSIEYQSIDLTQEAALFDISSLKQSP